MQNDRNVTTTSVVAISWLAAIAALGTALLGAALGQGLGAMLGGCGWIGASVPMHRQVWALVNQPVLNFSSLPGAGGYWLGSMLVPLLAAVILLMSRSRTPTLVGQLTLVQVVWWTALVAGVWLPLLDPGDGHIARWLLLHRLPESFVWFVPVVATVVAVGAGYRILAIARWRHRHPGRWSRLVIVAVSLLVPVGAWLLATTVLCGKPPLRPVLGLLVPATAVTVFAFLRYPPASPRPLKPPSPAGVAALVSAALIAVSALWWAGRPLPDDHVSGVVWGVPGSMNNIRPWIEPHPLVVSTEADTQR